MNVLILNWRDIQHPLAGGAEISLLEHAKFWQKKGATITWFSSTFPGSLSEETIDGIRYLRKGSHYTVHFWLLVEYFQKKVENIDVVIDSFHFLPFFTPVYMHHARKIALINEVAKQVWFDNTNFFLAAIGYTIEPLFFLFYKNVTFITASNSTKKDLIKVGIAEKNIAIVPHGVTIPRFSEKENKEKKPSLLFLNRISIDKGIKDAIVAYLLVKQKFPNCQLWIAGKEQKKGILNKIITSVLGKKNEIRQDITYFGFVSETQKFQLYARSWLLIHPSKREGWGLTVIEANAAGTPAVGYDVVGLKDSIQNGKTGLLVDSNSESLAEAAVQVIANDSLRNSLSKTAYNWSKNFSWEKSGELSWKIVQYSSNNA